MKAYFWLFFWQSASSSVQDSWTSATALTSFVRSTQWTLGAGRWSGCPGGVSPCSALDMAGHVWEWTSSLCADYPYQQDDGRENPEGKSSRVLRGGAFALDQYFARCAFRSNYPPSGRVSLIGFRLVVAPALPS